MRIGFVVYGSLDNVSGGFIYDRALVGALRALGHDVEVLALPWRGYFHAAGRHVLAGLARPRADGPAFDAIVQDELVHPSLFLFNRRVFRRARVRLALVHNLRSGQPGEPLAGVKAAIERRYLRSVDGVLAVCQRTLDDARALGGRALPGAVVHPGRDHLAPDDTVDDTFAAARAAEPGPLRVLHAAAVRPHKGLGRLLAALARAGACGLDFTLDVVGSLAARAHVRAVERQVARLGLDARVRLHGERTGSELRAAFRRAQVMALPSDSEAYSLSCLEALGFGLPVLATSRGGLGEMITNGREGLLLDPNDTEAWARALADLGRDRAALAATSRAALARHRAHGTWRDSGAAAAAFITERLARSERAAPDGR